MGHLSFIRCDNAGCVDGFLKIEQLGKTYVEAKPVFADVSFTIDRGEFVCIILLPRQTNTAMRTATTTTPRMTNCCFLMSEFLSHCRLKLEVRGLVVKESLVKGAQSIAICTL